MYNSKSFIVIIKNEMFLKEGSYAHQLRLHLKNLKKQKKLNKLILKYY